MEKTLKTSQQGTELSTAFEAVRYGGDVIPFASSSSSPQTQMLPGPRKAVPVQIGIYSQKCRRFDRIKAKDVEKLCV